MNPLSIRVSIYVKQNRSCQCQSSSVMVRVKFGLMVIWHSCFLTATSSSVVGNELKQAAGNTDPGLGISISVTDTVRVRITFCV